jgi:hypothetical protein
MRFISTASILVFCAASVFGQNADPMQPLITPTAKFDEAAAVRQQVKNGADAGQIADDIRRQRKELGQPDPGPAYYQKLMNLIQKEQQLDRIDDRIAMQKARLGEGWFASSDSRVRRPIQEQVRKLERERDQLRKDVERLTKEMNGLEEQALAGGMRP